MFELDAQGRVVNQTVWLRPWPVVTVLRDAMDIDELKSPALYMGTTTGQLWMGREGGEKWECLFDSLPPIHNVKVAVV